MWQNWLPVRRRSLQRFFRFRLSTLFILITIVAVGLGFFGVRWYRQLRETWAADSIRAAGGQIVVRKDGSVQRVWLGGKEFDDLRLEQVVPHLRLLPTLEELDIVEAPITDDGLNQLQQLQHVPLLYIHETKATDAGIAELARTLPTADIRRERPHPIATQLAARKIYPSAVISAAFSRDGKWLVSGSGDGTLRWWRRADWRLIEPSQAHVDWVFTIAFSPDGKVLATGGGDNAIALWNTEAREIEYRLIGHTDDVHSVAFHPNGKLLYSAGDDRVVRVWDLGARVQIDVLKGHTGAVPSLAISPDGATLATASRDGTVRLWDVASQQPMSVRSLAGHKRDVASVAFSRDGKQLASVGYDRTIRLWDTASGEALHVFEGHEDWVFAVTFAPDGRSLFSGSGDGTLRQWDIESGASIATYRGQSAVASVAYSPYCRTLATTGSDGTIFLRNGSCGRLVSVLRTRFGDRDLALPVFACATE